MMNASGTLGCRSVNNLEGKTSRNTEKESKSHPTSVGTFAASYKCRQKGFSHRQNDFLLSEPRQNKCKVPCDQDRFQPLDPVSK